MPYDKPYRSTGKANNRKKKKMEQPLLATDEKRPWLPTRVNFVEELKKVGYMAGPLVVVSLSQFLMLLVSLMMAGHLGELALSGVSIATSFCNVTGFSILFGLVGALDTLCGQAYGAGQYQNVGTFTYCAAMSLIPICLPISILWMFVEKVLILLGQEPQISVVAHEYSIYLIPALLGSALLLPLMRYFQSQSLILPMLFASLATLCIHIPLCWALIYLWKLGYRGAALAISFSDWLNVILLALYMRYSSSCAETRTPCWDNISTSIKQFFRFGVPSAVMVCLEWWTFELVILLAGLLPDATLETSVLSICLSVTALNYYVQSGIAAAASVRISNELGAGNPRAAQAVVLVVLVASLTESIIVSITLFCCRYVFGYAYSNDKEVVEYLTEMAPLLCLSIILDGLLALFSGIARGCGWQHIAAIVNLAAYYAVGIPVASLLCFVLHLRGKGLWIGLLAGSTLQAILLALMTALTDWQKQATKARERIFEGMTVMTVDEAC